MDTWLYMPALKRILSELSDFVLFLFFYKRHIITFHLRTGRLFFFSLLRRDCVKF